MKIADVSMNLSNNQFRIGDSENSAVLRICNSSDRQLLHWKRYELRNTEGIPDDVSCIEIYFKWGDSADCLAAENRAGEITVAFPKKFSALPWKKNRQGVTSCILYTTEEVNIGMFDLFNVELSNIPVNDKEGTTCLAVDFHNIFEDEHTVEFPINKVSDSRLIQYFDTPVSTHAVNGKGLLEWNIINADYAILSPGNINLLDKAHQSLKSMEVDISGDISYYLNAATKDYSANISLDFHIMYPRINDFMNRRAEDNRTFAIKWDVSYLNSLTLEGEKVDKAGLRTYDNSCEKEYLSLEGSGHLFNLKCEAANLLLLTAQGLPFKRLTKTVLIFRDYKKITVEWEIEGFDIIGVTLQKDGDFQGAVLTGWSQIVPADAGDTVYIRVADTMRKSFVCVAL